MLLGLLQDLALTAAVVMVAAAARASPVQGFRCWECDRRSSAALSIRSAAQVGRALIMATWQTRACSRPRCWFRLACARNAYAADPNSIFGRWIEKLPNRTGIVTEFKPQSIRDHTASHRAGHRVKEVGNFSVSYLNLSLSTIGVVFPGGGRSILILVKSRDTTSSSISLARERTR